MTTDHPEHEDEMRRFAHDLFGSGEEPDEPSAPTTSGNVVAKEGATVPPPQVDEMRDFVRDLFGGVSPDDHVRN